ncbi:hypothetical protein KUL42_19140 [Alteromonas sp. KUL42]|nr:hypothetical protein KUL42_19140 [Alteromonas sp. KUL42]
MSLRVNESFMFALAEPFDGKPATNGNGTMLGFHLDSVEEVNRHYQRAVLTSAAIEIKVCLFKPLKIES